MATITLAAGMTPLNLNAIAIFDCAHVSDALFLSSVTDLVEMASKFAKLFASQFAPARAPVIAIAMVNCALKGKDPATYEIVSDLKWRFDAPILEFMPDTYKAIDLLGGVTSCLDMRERSRTREDGEYQLSTGQGVFLRVYCYGMGTLTHPREYLILDSAAYEENYSQLLHRPR